MTAEQAEQLINAGHTFVGVLPIGKVVIQWRNTSEIYYLKNELISVNPHPAQAMLDLETAEAQLTKDNLSIVFVKDGQTIFSSGKTGLRPLVEAIQIRNETLEGSSMADKVVGRAAALLAIYAKVKTVYASTIASGAAQLLNQHNIPYRYGSMVKQILNRNGTDICPFEKSVCGTDNPEEALRQIIKTISMLALQQSKAKLG